MRYIDFHTHAYADKIAQRAIAGLVETAKMPAITDGTVGALRSLLARDGIDAAVLLPIATKPTQNEIVNSWAESVNGNGIISFGSVHPDASESLEYLEKIAAAGLRGIKLHPDYQGFFIDDEKRAYPIYEKCAELGLIVVFHAGFDPVSPDLIHASPQMYVRVLRDFPKAKFVAAHLGGMSLWNDVLSLAAGRFDNLYLDTAFVSPFIGGALYEKIIKTHGAERILLASDAPWESVLAETEAINKMNLTEAEREMIFFKNAEALLGL